MMVYFIGILAFSATMVLNFLAYKWLTYNK